MGEIYSITCKNKSCRYHKELRYGPGMMTFAKMKMFERAVIEDEVENKDAAERLKRGARIQTQGIYLCPKCQEIMNHRQYYLKEYLFTTPYGTERYDISFPFGKPQCPQCDTELIYIRNVLSSKVKCPKCGGDFSARAIGNYD